MEIEWVERRSAHITHCAQVMRLEAWRSRALGHTELSRAISVEEDLEEDDKLKLILRRESSTSLELPATPRKTS